MRGGEISQVQQTVVHLVYKDGAREAPPASREVHWVQGTVLPYNHHLCDMTLDPCPLCCDAKVQAITCVVGDDHENRAVWGRGSKNNFISYDSQKYNLQNIKIYK